MENIMPSNRGFVSGFIGVGIHMRIQHILQHIHIASRCKEELGNLKDLVMRIELIIIHIQQNRMAFKSSSKDKDTASAVNKWLTKLDGDLLLQSSKMVQRCSIRKSRYKFSRCQTEKEINRLITDITEHLKSSPLLVRIPEHQAGDTQKVIEGLGQIQDSVETLASCATTSQAAIASRGTTRRNSIGEPLKVGHEEQAIADLEKFVVDDVQAKNIGVLGNGGSGKALLLKQVFKSQKVRNHFKDGLLLWLTVSNSQSLSSVINQLCTQITTQTEVDLDQNMSNEQVEIWLKDRFMARQKIALFLNDVELLEGLDNIIRRLVADLSNCKVIVSSSDANALTEMGVPDNYRIKIVDWLEDGNLPSNVNEKEKLVRDKCGGLPLAINVAWGAIACNCHPKQWEWVLHRLEKAESLNDFLRLSFDAVGNEDTNMQLCFLHVAAAFPEGEIIDTREVIPLWMGEGLLAMQMLQNGPADRCFIEPMIINTEGHPVCLRMQNPFEVGSRKGMQDPFEVGRLYVDNLAEHCLIEPMERDTDGRVLCFRMLKVVRDFATQIAEDEENFYIHHHVGNHLTDLEKHESSEMKRIFLSRNNLRSLPSFLSSSEIQSLLISLQLLTKIPKKVIGRSMMSLKVLDLSGSLVCSLPENVACLKQLICLKLSDMPIKKLPKSLRDLGHLEILDLSFTKIKGLPSDIHMLRSLRYLGLRGCKDLLNLPHDIWGLISLQYLYMDGCSEWPKSHKKAASCQRLGDLIQLKQLALQNNGKEEFTEGNLGSMTEMDTLLLILPNLKSVPQDIKNMSKLKRLSFKCSKLEHMDSFRCFESTETVAERRMQNDVTKFKHLSYLKFYECSELEQFQHLQELPNLRQLEIILCPKVKNFPRSFGEEDAFPSLKIFSLVGLKSLKELPVKEEGAMRYLQRLNIMGCPELQSLPESFLNPKIKLRVYGCSLEVGNGNLVEVVTMPKTTEKIIEEYLQVHQKEDRVYKEDQVHSEFWCNGLFQFVKDLGKDIGMIFP